jgi:hypothetical protein
MLITHLPEKDPERIMLVDIHIDICRHPETTQADSAQVSSGSCYNVTQRAL